ncbi:MAG TPA: hypothetical protein VEV43_02200 [Actinomycetota bacterium]|nr:hypothetical protein [Actinomycetota bacterium]
MPHSGMCGSAAGGAHHSGVTSSTSGVSVRFTTSLPSGLTV